MWTLLPPFPSPSGGAGVLANRELQVATGYSPGTPLENYQFTSIQTAINYAVDNLNPSVQNPVVVKIYPGLYVENINMQDNVHLVGSGDPYSLFLTNVGYTAMSESATTGIYNLRILNLTVGMNSPAILAILNCVFVNTPSFAGTNGASQIGIVGAVFADGAVFGPFAPPTFGRSANVEISDALFEMSESQVEIATTGADNSAFINIRNSKFRNNVEVVVGNGSVSSVLRANNCVFENNGSTAVMVNDKAFANLLDSVISQTAVAGLGTADMNIMMVTFSIPSDEPPELIPFGFGGFGTIGKVSDTNYSVSITSTSADPATSGVSLFTKDQTGVAFEVETGDITYDITIIRNWSNI